MPEPTKPRTSSEELVVKFHLPENAPYWALAAAIQSVAEEFGGRVTLPARGAIYEARGENNANT